VPTALAVALSAALLPVSATAAAFSWLRQIKNSGVRAATKGANSFRHYWPAIWEVQRWTHTNRHSHLIPYVARLLDLVFRTETQTGGTAEGDWF